MDTGLYGAEPANSQPVDLSISGAARALSAPATLSPLAAAIEDWEKAGFGDELLPVLPIDGMMDEKLRPNAGKIPGRLIDGGRCVGFVGWSEVQPTAQERAEWRTWPGFGLCLRTAKYPTLDIDIDDKDFAAEIVDLILASLPPGALVRRRPGSSRVAVIVRSDDRAPKDRRAFTLPSDPREHAVELLWDGQQVVVAGRHRSGTAYQLDAPRPPDWTAKDLPCVSAANLERLLAEIVARIGQAGGTVAASASRHRVAWNGALDPEQAVMAAVNGRRNAWLPDLLACFGGPSDLPWRITSDELGRDLQEDLISYPDSLYDQGAERAYTPVSLAMTFGRVDAHGSIGFGGSPRYGLKGGRIHVAASLPGENRPTRTQVLRWLGDRLDGPRVPPDASDDILLTRLAAAVGLDWQALCAEHARKLGFTPVDDAGAPIPEPPPEAWDLDLARRNVKRLAARRALHPAGYDEWLKGRDFGSDELEDAFELVDALAHAWTPPEPAQTPATAAERAFEDALPPTPIVGLGPAEPTSATFATFTGIPDVSGIPTREHVIFPRMPSGDVLLTVAAPGASKSTLALHDALVIATGREDILRGPDNASPERLHTTGPVLIHDGEDPLPEMKRRLAAMARHHGVSEFKHPIHLWSGVSGDPLWIARRDRSSGALVLGEGAAALTKAIVETGAVFVTIGPFAGLAEGMNENDAGDAEFVMRNVHKIADRTGACINVIHHTSKSGSGEAGDMKSSRGSFAIPAKVRAMVTLNGLTDADAQRYGVSARGHIAMHYAKVSHGQKPEYAIIIRRDSAPVGNGTGPSADPRGAFDLPARDALRLQGDHAPVLTVVKFAEPVSQELAKELKRVAVEDGISAAILATMGGANQRLLTDIMSDLIAQLNARKVISAKAPATVRERLKAHLGDLGKSAEHDGQDVLIRLVKAGPKEKDPWLMTVEPVSKEMLDRGFNIPDIAGG